MGIILFELLYPCSTQMERMHAIANLRLAKPALPADFESDRSTHSQWIVRIPFVSRFSTWSLFASTVLFCGYCPTHIKRVHEPVTYANQRSTDVCFRKKCPVYVSRKVVQHIWRWLADKINRQQRANSSKDVVASHRRRSVEQCHHRFFNLIAIRNQSMSNDLHEARDRRWRELLWIFLIFYSLSLSPWCT